MALNKCFIIIIIIIIIQCKKNISYKNHITNEILCNKIQAAIGPYEYILIITVKKEATTVRTCDQIKWSLQKRSYKAQYQGKEKEEGKRKDGKTKSESGQVSISTAVREQPKTVRNGRRLSPMSTVVPLRR